MVLLQELSQEEADLENFRDLVLGSPQVSLKVKQVYEALPSGMEDGADSMPAL